MTTRQMLAELVSELPDERIEDLLDFAQYLTWKNDRANWRRFGQVQFAKAYGNDEPEYTESDLLRNDEP